MLLSLATGLQIKCFHKKQHSTTTELIFRVQFHTCFVKDFEMVFTKDELDEAHRGVCRPLLAVSLLVSKVLVCML